MSMKQLLKKLLKMYSGITIGTDGRTQAAQKSLLHLEIFCWLPIGPRRYQVKFPSLDLTVRSNCTEYVKT